MHSRRFISILLIAICSVASGCSWDEFIQYTTTEVHVNVPIYRLNSDGTGFDATGVGCGHFNDSDRTIILNDDPLCEDAGYNRAHEQGHAIALAIGLDYPGTINNQEYAADCLAAIRGYPDGRYWHCPKWALDYARQLLNKLTLMGTLPESR